jgi:hypothetical protein
MSNPANDVNHYIHGPKRRPKWVEFRPGTCVVVESRAPQWSEVRLCDTEAIKLMLLLQRRFPLEALAGVSDD